jgi:hypothetical protein
MRRRSLCVDLSPAVYQVSGVGIEGVVVAPIVGRLVVLSTNGFAAEMAQ